MDLKKHVPTTIFDVIMGQKWEFIDFRVTQHGNSVCRG